MPLNLLNGAENTAQPCDFNKKVKLQLRKIMINKASLKLKHKTSAAL